MSNEDKITKMAQATSGETILNADQEISPGSQLKSAREALGLTVKQVADKLHLRIPSIEALEQDVLESGVSVTFSKGYVRLYARLVKLDAEPLLKAYDKVHCLDNQPAKMQSFSRRVSREADDHKWNMVTIVIVLMVLGSVIGWWVQQTDSLNTSQSFVAATLDKLFSEGEEAALSPDLTSTNVDIEDKNENAAGLLASSQDIERLNTGPEIPEEELVNTASNIVVSNQPEQAELGLDLPLDEDTTSNLPNANISAEIEVTQAQNNEPSTITTVADVTRSEQLPLEPSDPGASIDTASNDAQQTSTEQATATVEVKLFENIMINDDNSVDMAFTFNEECWVSVKDVNDEVIAIGVKAKGRIMQVSGVPPIQFIICAPQKASLDFGGKDVDLSGFSTTRPAVFSLTLREKNVFRVSN